MKRFFLSLPALAFVSALTGPFDQVVAQEVEVETIKTNYFSQAQDPAKFGRAAKPSSSPQMRIDQIDDVLSILKAASPQQFYAQLDVLIGQCETLSANYLRGQLLPNGASYKLLSEDYKNLATQLEGLKKIGGLALKSQRLPILAKLITEFFVVSKASEVQEILDSTRSGLTPYHNKMFLRP